MFLLEGIKTHHVRHQNVKKREENGENGFIHKAKNGKCTRAVTLSKRLLTDF